MKKILQLKESLEMKNLLKNKKVIAVILGIIIVIIAAAFIITNNKDDIFQVENVDINSQENSNNSSENSTQGNNQSNTNSQTSDNSEKKDNNANLIYIHIIGEINNPGVITLEKGQRIVDAVEKAGGTTKKADLTKINLAFVLSDGLKVKVPSIYDKENEVYVTQNSGNNTITEGSTLNRGGGKVNINSATQTELETLAGIGPSLANRILEYREKNGKFKKVEDLKNVKGIGQSKFDGIKDEVVVD